MLVWMENLIPGYTPDSSLANLIYKTRPKEKLIVCSFRSCLSFSPGLLFLWSVIATMSYGLWNKTVLESAGWGPDAAVPSSKWQQLEPSDTGDAEGSVITRLGAFLQRCDMELLPGQKFGSEDAFNGFCKDFLVRPDLLVLSRMMSKMQSFPALHAQSS